jgi:hypothetical protein
MEAMGYVQMSSHHKHGTAIAVHAAGDSRDCIVAVELRSGFDQDSTQQREHACMGVRAYTLALTSEADDPTLD